MALPAVSGLPSFRSLYRHGFFRVAIATPVVSLASPADNARETVRLAGAAAERGAGLVLFPELGITGYANDDLFFQQALLDAAEAALAEVLAASVGLPLAIILGLPVRAEAKLFNCAAVIHRGAVLGVAPKSYLPNYREFYEKRQFCPARQALSPSIPLLGRDVPFGADLIFEARACPGFALHVEICEDLWAPIPPSSTAALAGATVLANLSASNATIGKADYRRLLCASQSGRCVAAYLYAAAGFGESTTDLAWDGQALVYENGDLLAEGDRFAMSSHLVFADVDLDRLVQERARLTSFNDGAEHHRDVLAAMRRLPLAFDPPASELPLARAISRFPYVPSDRRRRDERCREVYEIQVQGLAQRLRATKLQKAVIGVSGGLDSAQALLVTARAFDRLNLPRAQILAYSLPGFATSEQSRRNALRLAQGLGASAAEIDIRPAARRMLEDIGHPFARGEPLYDKTFENVQAGERASHLFRLANHHAALVIGTSDLSELALGYTTYGVGDHMAHYSVNASVPKTLLRYLIRWVIETGELPEAAAAAFADILAIPASPELVPAKDGALQRAEDEIGPYELQDFNLYYLSRYGYRPSRIAFLADHAWDDAERGDWPDPSTALERHAYDLPTIKKWLEIFLFRFIEQSQFKRSALPNGPKVGSGGSLSPRGDWRAPSDADARAWIEELRRNVP
ncbi:MAG TPA: NAD(+) synthase [Stellaceae bacterium]|nr:NAD(+) synthase [Stellaceae bacterium]